MLTPDDPNPEALDAFIERRRPAQAAELANAQQFLIELAALLSVSEPEPATRDTARTFALRRVLRELDRPMTVEALSRRFKRASRTAVADILDTLVLLGQARCADAFAA